MFDHILVVCVGNICRSPVAEAMLQQKLPHKNISSAGLAAVVGADIDPTAREVAGAYGLDCPHHAARQLTLEMCVRADLILVMENAHREAITRMLPTARGKVFLLGGIQGGREIPDPYRCSRELFVFVHELLESCVADWVSKLRVEA